MKFKLTNKAIVRFNRGGISLFARDGVFDTENYYDPNSMSLANSPWKIDMRYSTPLSAVDLKSAQDEIVETITNMVTLGQAEILDEKPAKAEKTKAE